MATKQPPSTRKPSQPDSTELSVVPAVSDPASEPLEATGKREAYRDDSAAPNDPDTAEISVIDAVEDSSSASRELGGAAEHGNEDRAPTQVMKMAFSDIGPPDLEPGARPLEVRTWRGPIPAGGPASDLRSGGSGFAIAESQHRGPRDPTRVDTELEVSRHAPVDLEALGRDLDDIERLLRATKAAAASLTIEAARGMNAQLTAALHRVVEARARLR
ncbi:MAG: hypothetical protein IT383_02100 [Deltaproteobacteria bacterium]|nr:hypothetical protein [Deltaproteobacteria bacterium]